MNSKLRELIPFGLRVGIRRTPALILHYLTPESFTRQHGQFRFIVVQRKTPMYRQVAPYSKELQAAKEHNLKKVISFLDGLIVEPSEVFSWHKVIGPPIRLRGFVPGPELHNGVLSVGGGGGACQASNLLFWLAINSGMKIIERHRHALDLFPDDNRDVPFGSGATVFYPNKDLKLLNPHKYPLKISMKIDEGLLCGEISSPQDLGLKWEIRETRHRFVKIDGTTYRENELRRVVIKDQTEQHDSLLIINRAVVTYQKKEI